MFITSMAVANRLCVSSRVAQFYKITFENACDR